LKLSPLRYDPALTQQKLREVLAFYEAIGFFYFVGGSAPDPSVGIDGQWALKTDVSPWKIWLHTGGIWVEQSAAALGVNPKGAWNSGTAYVIGDSVSLNGTSYIAIANNTNQTPPNATYWQVLAAKGDTGPAAWTPPAAWTTATAYTVGPPASVVTQNGSTYVCIVSHTSGTFATDLAAGKWQLVAQRGNDGANYAATSTTSLVVGTGTKSLTTQLNLAYTAGARVRLSHAADITKYMEGLVTAYDSGTGAMSINVLSAVGSGTFNDWSINIAGDPGSADFITVRRFEYTITTSTNTVSGADINGRTLVYTAGFIDVTINGSTLAPSEFTATSGSSVVFARNLNIGDTVYINASLAYNPADALANSQSGADISNKALFRRNLDVQRKNYIINGGMQISQENGSSAVSASGSYPVDQFWILNGSDGALTAQQVASLTPGGSPNRVRITVTTADAAVGATNYVRFEQILEGSRTADLKLGSSLAKTVTLQFGVRAPAGTYCVALRGAGHSYIGEYTITAGEANTDVVRTVTVALDQTGTWPTDANASLSIAWCLMAGSSFQQAAGNWATNASMFGSSNQFNFMGTVGNVFELFDVGLYEGTVAPSFELPDIAKELALCQRYWETGTFFLSTVSGVQTNRAFQWTLPFKVQKRVAPTMALSGVTNLRSTGTAVASVTSERLVISVNNTNADGDDFNTGGTWKANARM
jgi:hypothetical protein